MIELKSKSEFDKFVQNKGAVVQFSTTWCNPCKMLKPHMEKVSDVIHEPVAFIYVDTAEEGEELQSEFDINSVPQIMRFDNGDVVKIASRNAMAIIKELGNVVQ